MRTILLLAFLAPIFAFAADDDEPARLYRRVYFEMAESEPHFNLSTAEGRQWFAERRAAALATLRDIEKRFPKWRPDVVARGLEVLARPAAGPASGQAGADPFVKEKASAAANAAPPAELPEMIAIDGGSVLRTTLETWSLSQADLLAVLEAPNAEQHRRVIALADGGKAKLENVIALTNKSGQRGIVEAIDEVRYPTTWEAPAGEGEIAFPTEHEMRNVGDTLELESVLGPDGETIEVNLVPQSVRFLGFREWRAEPRAEPQLLADFETAKITTYTSIRSGVPKLLGTMTPAHPPEQAGTRAVVAFLRVDVIAVPLPEPAMFPKDRGFNLQGKLTLISLDRATAHRLLAEELDDERCHAAVQALVEKGEARVERALPIVAKSGQKMMSEQIQEVKYPTKWVPPLFIKPASDPGAAEPREKRLAPRAVENETRNAGLTLEIEPVISPEGTVELGLVPNLVEYRGPLQAGEAAARQPPLPVFSMQKLTTSVAAPLGGHALLGTMSPPRDSGVNDRKDDGRTWLAFMRFTPDFP